MTVEAIHSGIDLSHVDSAARPQDDLFGHVNGRWLTDYQIPADRATDGPEDAVLQGLTNAELMACVAQLGDEQRECIALRFLQGLSVAETAAAMGKKDGAVKALQHRAVKRLATLLPEGLR